MNDKSYAAGYSNSVFCFYASWGVFKLRTNFWQTNVSGLTRADCTTHEIGCQVEIHQSWCACCRNSGLVSRNVNQYQGAAIQYWGGGVDSK